MGQALQVCRRQLLFAPSIQMESMPKGHFHCCPQRLQHFTATDNFVGFYYVCVDFNPQPAAPAIRPVAESMPLTPDNDECFLPPLPAKNETPQAVRIRRDSSVKRGGRAPSVGPRSGTPVPTMSGFYFHQNSEPCVSLFTACSNYAAQR